MNKITILLAEDDDIDAQVLQREFAKAKIDNKLVRAHDGVEALDLLRGKGREPLSRPVVLLADINMPQLDGMGLLREIRADPKLTQTVVFMLTSSDDDRDRDRAYGYHVAGYVVKSRSDREMGALMSMLKGYLTVVRPPA